MQMHAVSRPHNSKLTSCWHSHGQAEALVDRLSLLKVTPSAACRICRDALSQQDVC